MTTIFLLQCYSCRDKKAINKHICTHTDIAYSLEEELSWLYNGKDTSKFVLQKFFEFGFDTRHSRILLTKLYQQFIVNAPKKIQVCCITKLDNIDPQDKSTTCEAKLHVNQDSTDITLYSNKITRIVFNEETFWCLVRHDTAFCLEVAKALVDSTNRYPQNPTGNRLSDNDIDPLYWFGKIIHHHKSKEALILLGKQRKLLDRISDTTYLKKIESIGSPEATRRLQWLKQMGY